MKEFQGNIKAEFDEINTTLNGIPQKIEDAKYIYQAAMYKYDGTGAINSGATIPFTKEIYNTAGEKIVFNSDGTITINHTGFIKVSFGLWVHSSNVNARPWARFRRKSDLFVFADALNDISANYVVIGVANVIVPVAAGQIFDLSVNVNAGDTFKLDEGNGFKNSFITIELL